VAFSLTTLVFLCLRPLASLDSEVLVCVSVLSLTGVGFASELVVAAVTVDRAGSGFFSSPLDSESVEYGGGALLEASLSSPGEEYARDTSGVASFYIYEEKK
jgi:hypothetical protein